MKKYASKKLIAGLSSAFLAVSAIPFTGLPASAAETVYGDVNLDGDVTLADSLAILQFIANEEKYPLTDQQKDNADVFNRGDGITAMDSLSIQKYDTQLITELPESWKDQPEDPVSDSTKIHLNGSSITVDGDNATVSGSTVTITHSGSFYIDGTLDDGQICVNIPDEAADPDTVKIFLNGVNITGKSAPAILVSNAENTSINIADGTENVISDGDTAYAGDYAGAAVIEAKDDLTIKGGDNGTGKLTLTANTQTGISCNNDIKINGGVISVTTLNSTDNTDGIKAKKSITIKDGTVTVDAEGDGIKSTKDTVIFSGGYTSIKAGNDAVQAETTIDVSGGTLIAGGDRGLTAVTGINLTGGIVYATAIDNQADQNILTVSQTTMLLNCIDDVTNEKDGTWKKANAISGGSKVEFTKKYKYVLISGDTAMNGMRSCALTNTSTGAKVTHTDGKQTLFQLNTGLNVFDNVDPSGISEGTVTPDPVNTDELTITLGTNMSTNASAEVASVSNNVCTIKQPGVFTVTGEMTGGQIVVDVDKTAYPDGVVELDLSGMSLTNTADSPVYVASVGKEVVIVSKKDTVNTISDGTSYTNADSDTGAIYSKDDLKFKGKGTLTVNGNAADAIVSKDDIKIYNGNLIVNAADDGIRGKDSVTIGNTSDDGTEVDYSSLSVKVTTKAGDGIKATAADGTTTAKQCGIVTINGGTVDIDSYADGIQAEQFFVMNGGDVNIKTYEGSSYSGTGNTGNTGGNTGGWGRPGGFGMDGNSNKSDISAKGIKAVGVYADDGTTWQEYGNIDINGGTLTIDSSDDCIHCSGEAVLNAGKLKLASSDDAVHSDGSLYIGGKTAGTDYISLEVYVTACYEGMEAAYIYQNNGNIYIISRDDGYNAAGGADSSGGNNNTGFNQGGWGFPGGMGGSSYGEMNLNGGIVSVNTSFQDADGFDSNGPVVFNGGYYFGNGGDSFDSGDGYSITYNGGYAFGGLGMNGGSGYDMSTQMVFTTSDGTVLASSMSGSRMSYAYGDSNVTAYAGAEITGGTNISTLGQPAVYISGKASGGTAKQLSQGSSSTQPGFPGGRF